MAALEQQSPRPSRELERTKGTQERRSRAGRRGGLGLVALGGAQGAEPQLWRGTEGGHGRPDPSAEVAFAIDPCCTQAH